MIRHKKPKRKRWILIAASLLATLILALGTAVLVVQSAWFYNKVRLAMVTAVENATGGRVEIRAFRFDWKRLRAEVDDFTLHGTEPVGKAPLFHAASVAVGLKIVSLPAVTSQLDRDLSIQYLDVASPQIDLIIGPDGRTNIPKPKTPGSGKDPSETILKLAIGRFNLSNGMFALDSQQKAPFALRGQNLNLHLLYDGALPRYHGDISIEPLQADIPDIERTPVAFKASLSFEKNRIDIESAHITANAVDIQLSGALQDLSDPHLAVKYQVRTTMPAVARIVRTKLMDRGDLLVVGNAQWNAAASDFSATGTLHAYNLYFQTGNLRLQNFRAEGAVAATSKTSDIRGLRFSGSVNDQAVTGRVETGALRGDHSRPHGNLLDLRGVELAGVGGSFHGNALLSDFDHFHVTGDYAGLDIRRAAALYIPQALPWDGLASGTATLDGSLNNSAVLTIASNVTISPAAGTIPINGQVAAVYDVGADTLDLGRSAISLPHSRAVFSGVLGRTLIVHLETTDLSDLLPALGPGAPSIPVKLQKGTAVFDGAARGRMDAPNVSGRLSATNIAYNQDLIDSLAADVEASPNSITLHNAAISHGSMHGEFQATAALRNFELERSGSISASASIRNAKAADLVALLKPGAAQMTGTVNISAQVSGSIDDPRATADIDAVQGAFNGESFDRIAGRASYSGGTVELTGGQFNAGLKQVTLTGSYTHDQNRFDTGRIHFQLASNAMPLQQIHTLQQARPGAAGTLQINASGVVDLTPPSAGREGYRIEELHATVAALDLRLDGQPFGNARLTANSQNGVLQTHLDSDFAHSAIKGDGQVQLTGDYPATAVVNFSQLDFNQLHDWLSPTAPSAPNFTGAAEGELRVDGSALKPETFKAELRVPKFQLSPVTQIGTAAPITLTNTGPIIARLANSVISVDSAHFTGRSTDLSLTGKVSLRAKSPLDLRVDGHVDLAELHDIDRDLSAEGTVSANATVRGDFASPQINGRLQFEKAALNIIDFPNGLSNATGSIAFTGDRATIQDLSGETGGGKVDLSGFATYADGKAVFRIHAAARSVRVRKPEGVSTVANADLNFTGSTARSMVSGTITILRTAFNPDSDFSSVLAQSTEPVQTPAAQTGLLGGLNFDVQISTAPDIQVQSTLTQDVQIDANLRLRGSATNPALLGRVNITQGQLMFFGTKYTVDGGSISFYNPVKIAPVLDIDLNAKAQGIDITLTISGPADHLTLIPSSDPPFTYNEIISLLATGRAPSSDPALLSAQNTDPAAYQQSGPSSLLGSAIATPVSGRLQRFFGVSSLRIDPTIPGVDANPGARLTMEQQVSPNITFTYITNVTTSNPQIVQVEWALSKKWSVVALREENGMTGMDFFFKKRF